MASNKKNSWYTPVPARRAQAARQHARVVQSLLRGFDELGRRVPFFPCHCRALCCSFQRSFGSLQRGRHGYLSLVFVELCAALWASGSGDRIGDLVSTAEPEPSG